MHELVNPRKNGLIDDKQFIAAIEKLWEKKNSS
jgi:hypothetical protein